MTARNNLERGVTSFPDLSVEHVIGQLAADIGSQLLVEVDSSGYGIVGTANSRKIIGVNTLMRTRKTGKGRVNLGLGPQFMLADLPVTPGMQLKAYAAGKAGPMLDGSVAAATVKTSAAGSAFTNQPANDGVEIVSSSAADTTQSATVIGTTTGGNVVVAETVALNGTTVVSTVKTDWGVILAVKLSASCAGTVTFREASADQTITTMLTTTLTKGVDTVAAGAAQSAYNGIPSATGSGASTKQVGIRGTNSAGTTIYDSIPLNGTTAAAFVTAFRTIDEVYTGDVEGTRTATIKTAAAVDSPDYYIGKALSSSDATSGRFRGILVP